MLRRVLFLLFPAFFALGLAGCDALEDAFPRTTAGFRDGGIVGAFQGAAAGALAICATLDGEEVRVLVDLTAAEFGAEDSVAAIRARRIDACRKAGAASALVDGVAIPLIEAHKPAG
jgi:hypothetical protein